MDMSAGLKAAKDALANNELIVYYQPQYDSITNKLVSAEALVRRKLPDGTVMSPGSFVPAAEETDLIMEIDWNVLDQVCRFIKSRIDSGERYVPIAVNFSRRHITENDFFEKLCGTVDGCGVSRNLIEVEITESAMMDGGYDIVGFVDRIVKEGFKVAIDDFGSGLSSLSLVKDISADIIKIDRSLLSGNCENEKERIVLESIFDFAHRLKLTTIAEGVETREQLGFLRTCGCQLIQGFLFAKPMPEEDFREACSKRVLDEETEDILVSQAPASVTSLLMEAVFMKYPLVIMANLTRNSFFMMAYENFSSRSCPSTGVFDELIVHGASTMHPDDKELFSRTFSRKNLLDAYARGEKFVKVVTRQVGDDGIYRSVETTDFFVKNPSVDDVLVVTLCQNLDE